MMHGIVTYRFSWILMLASMLGGWAGTWHSHDGVNILLASHPSVASHDCGDHERHLPSEQTRHCAVCASQAQRFAVPPSSEGSVSALAALGCTVPDDSTLLLTGSCFSPGQRGPPAA